MLVMQTVLGRLCGAVLIGSLPRSNGDAKDARLTLQMMLKQTDVRFQYLRASHLRQSKPKQFDKGAGSLSQTLQKTHEICKV